MTVDWKVVVMVLAMAGLVSYQSWVAYENIILTMLVVVAMLVYPHVMARAGFDRGYYRGYNRALLVIGGLLSSVNASNASEEN